MKEVSNAKELLNILIKEDIEIKVKLDGRWSKWARHTSPFTREAIRVLTYLFDEGKLRVRQAKRKKEKRKKKLETVAEV